MKKKSFGCLLFLYLLLLSNIGFCASANVSELYQEAAWISLDLPQMQRSNIDEIIVKKNEEIKAIIKKAAILTVANKASTNKQSYDLMNFYQTMKKINDIRLDACSEIMAELTSQQQEELVDRLEKRSAQAGSAIEMLRSFNLEDDQQAKVFAQMLLCQKTIWSIAANTKLSWEQRRRKMQTVNTLKLIESYLSTDQKATLKNYEIMMMYVGQE
jgi:hypothetical protein